MLVFAAGAAIDEVEMNRRTKKLLGIPLIVLILILYSWLGVFIYELGFMTLPNWAQVIYFAVAGFGWFFPAAWAIKWMSAPGPGENEDPYADL